MSVADAVSRLKARPTTFYREMKEAGQLTEDDIAILNIMGKPVQD